MLLGFLSMMGMGCTPAKQRNAAVDLGPVYQAYQTQDYERAYTLASTAAGQAGDLPAMEAAYMAGMSAYQLGRWHQAEHYLRYPAGYNDVRLAADAKAGLGLVYLQQGKLTQAEATLRDAAGNLSGQDRANAYFYIGLAQQRQGLWHQARTWFTQARALSKDADFVEQCNQQLAYTGYTLQTGAFTQQSNAQREAQKLAQQVQQAGLGLPRVVTATGADGKRLYLVQVGQFSTLASAANARARVGVGSAIVTPIASAGR